MIINSAVTFKCLWNFRTHVYHIIVPIFNQLHRCTSLNRLFNTLRLRQNGCHFGDVIFKCIFMNEKFCISIPTSLKFVSRGPIDNKSALVQVMAWRRPGDKPLSEPMMASLLGHICITRPQWINRFLWELSWHLTEIKKSYRNFQILI